MPQRAERSQPAAPAILRRDVSAGLVGFGGFYLRNCVDVLSPPIVELFHFDRADLIDRVTCRDPVSLRLSPTWRVLCYRESNSASSIPVDILARWISPRHRDRANRRPFKMECLSQPAFNTRSMEPSCALRSKIAASTRFDSRPQSSKSRLASRLPHPRDSSSTDTNHGARRAVAM